MPVEWLWRQIGILRLIPVCRNNVFWKVDCVEIMSEIGAFHRNISCSFAA